MPITHRKRGKQSCRNLCIRLSATHFVMQGRRRTRRRAVKNKAWGKPLLPLFLLSAHASSFRLSLMAVFCICPCLPSEHFHMMTNSTGFRFSMLTTTNLFFAPAVNMQVRGLELMAVRLFFFFFAIYSFPCLIRIMKSKWA